MEYMQGPGGFYVENDTAITMGKFDGLHRGHQKLIGRIRKLENRDCKSVVFTLNRMEKRQILTDAERKEMAERLGVQYLIDCPLVQEISQMEPETFVEEILVRRLHAKHLIVGTDFRFGYQRRGDYKLLRGLQRKYDFYVEVVKKEQYHGRDISSTYVREELADGHVETVNDLLGYPFFVSGEVLHGRRGDRIHGIQVVNLITSTRKLLPPDGVYVTQTRIGEQYIPGITYIGGNVEEGKHFRGIETFLIDFDRDLFGETIEVQFLKFLRPEMEDECTAAKLKDISAGKEYFGE